MVATNLVSSLHRHAALRLQNKESTEQQITEFGDMVSVVAFATGVLMEGVDAFWCAESILTPLFHRNAHEVDNERYNRFLQAASKRDGTSVYCQLIRPIRDEAAFHWKRSSLEACLQHITNQDSALMCILNEDEVPITARYVVADFVLSLVMFGNTSDATLVERVASLRDFANLFMEVAEEALALYLREHGAVAVDTMC